MRIVVPCAALLGAALLSFQLPARRPAEAGTAISMDLEQLVEGSDLVVEARVISRACGEDPTWGIHTDYLLSVDRAFCGTARGNLSVRLPGGILADGRGLAIPGLPVLSPGEDVFLFLGPAGPGGRRMTTGLSQGKYRIASDGRGGRFAVRAGGAGGASVEYAEMVARLSAAAVAREQRAWVRSEADAAEER